MLVPVMTRSMKCVVVALATLLPMGCCGGGSEDAESAVDDPAAADPNVEDPGMDPAAADPNVEDPSGVPGSPPNETAAAPRSPVPFGPENAKGYEPNAVGFCSKAIGCKCASVAGLNAEACAEKFTAEVLKGKPMPAPLWSCFLQMSCEDLCADRTAAAEPCVKAAVAAAGPKGGGRSGHDTAMGIIENMGSTCPPGTRKVNGSCVNY